MVNRLRLKQYLNKLGIEKLNNIKEIRENLGLSVEDLAEICGISSGEVSMVENQLRIPNQITIFLILRGFKKLDVNPHDVFIFY